MTIQIIRNTEGVITTGKFCLMGSAKQKKPIDFPPISCASASNYVVLSNSSNYFDLSSLGTAPTMDIYINNTLVKSNLSSYIYDLSGGIPTILEFFEQYTLTVYTDSSNYLYIYNQVDEPVQIRLVPKSDGEYNGDVIDKKFLKLANNDNNSATHDQNTGVVSFCLNGGAVA